MSGGTGAGEGRPERTERLLEQLASSTVLVIGDAMVDRYLRGDVDRVSPEAPVPVVRVRESETRPGGAANVAAGVTALGAECRLVAAAGRDDAGRLLRELLTERGIDAGGMLDVGARPTTVKTRVIGRDQQMLRLDREERSPLADDEADRLTEAVLAALPEVDAVAVADYGKGLLAGAVAPRVLGAARERGVPVVVDPSPERLGAYAGATLLKPNAEEAAAAVEGSRPPSSDAGLAELRRRLEVGHLLVTLGDEGMALVGPDGAVDRIPAERVEVYDVTGAGDTVTAVLAAAIPHAAGMGEAARLANRAAALEVQKLGARAITRAEL